MDLRRRNRSVSSPLVAIATAVVLTLASAGVATGDNWGSMNSHGGTPAYPCDDSINSQCIANNGYHVFRFVAAEADQVSSIRGTCSGDYDPVADVDCVEVSSGWVDLEIWDDDYNTEYWAWTRCSRASDTVYGGSDPYRWCKAQLLLYDLGTSTWKTTSGRAYLACHEFGHSLGLRHRTSTDTCMMKNQVTVGTIPAYHEVAHLNMLYAPPDPRYQ